MIIRRGDHAIDHLLAVRWRTDPASPCRYLASSLIDWPSLARRLDVVAVHVEQGARWMMLRGFSAPISSMGQTSYATGSGRSGHMSLQCPQWLVQ
jgi:hypothetical protein